MRSSKLRFYLPLAILVFFGLRENVDIIKRELRKSHRPAVYQELEYGSRLAPLRKYLTRDATVGYVTDQDAELGHRIAYFYLAQYHLCPTLVVWGKDYPYVIGGYYGLDNPNKSATADLVLVEDFGEGIELYRGTLR